MPLRIALVHAYSWPEVRRGGERLLDDLTTYLRAVGHAVDVYSGTTGESSFHHGANGRSYRMHIPWLRALEGYGLSPVETFGIRALVPLLVHRYDVVHAFTPTAALASVAAGQSTLYTVIGHPGPADPSGRVQRRTLARAITSSTEVAALSRSAAESITKTFGRAPQVLPPGVSMDRWRVNLEPRSGPPRILYSGDLRGPRKGIPILLAAFDRLRERHPEARLMLSGPRRAEWAMREIGSIRARIEPFVDELGAGTVDDVPERYRSAHVTVLPSRDEAFGIVLVESLACGTPVIGGTPGGPDDIVTSEVGRLVEYGDVDALADAIDECIGLAADPATPARCRSLAEAWDWSRIGPRYEGLYESIAGRRTMPGVQLWRAARISLGARSAPSAAPPSPS